MTLPAVTGNILPAFLRGFLVATDALPVKNLPQVPSTPGTVALLAPDPGLPGFEITFLQDILPLLIPVMAILAGEVSLHMAAVRKGNRWPFAGLKRRAHQRQGLRLGSEK
jgi:hypothetical protein